MRTFHFIALAAGLSVAAGATLSAVEDKPKLTIKEIMEKAHRPEKTSLLDTIKAEKGSKEDKEKLVELYTMLGQNKPPKGDAKSWKEKTEALLTAAKDVAGNKEGAIDKLKKATAEAKCMACHDAHSDD
jgi:hypothetical protein